jgi:hypothetical protein
MLRVSPNFSPGSGHIARLKAVFKSLASIQTLRDLVDSEVVVASATARRLCAMLFFSQWGDGYSVPGLGRLKLG